jgi:hypothetical protein
MQLFNNKIAVLIISAIIAISNFSCQKGLTGDGLVNITPVDDLSLTKASIQGYVTNENGLPVNGALVTAGTSITTTDSKGFFRFSDINISKNNGYVKVSMAGYFTGSRSFVTNTGRVNHVRIRLMPKVISGNIDATTGGSVTLSSGIVIKLPAAGVVNASSNTAYTGTVNVAASWIDPTGSALTEIMPGDLRGINSAGNEMGLQTFGMVAVELTGSGGELLQIATGKKATVNFSIPSSIASLAPNTIPLWYFDEAKGRWKEEGTATKIGNTYIADVSHFSFWNCDAQFPLITFSATVLSESGKPLVNAQVRIKRVTNNSFASGITDSMGFVSGKIPSNEDLVLEVLDQCGVPVFSKNIGPFSKDVALGNITVSASSVALITVSGTINDCSNAAVTNGYVEIFLAGRYYRVKVTNGTFTATFTNCSTNASFTILGVDNVANEQSSSQTISISSQNIVVPAFQACGTSSLQTIDYTVDGNNYHIVSPPDSIYGYGGGSGTNGDYVGGFKPSSQAINISFSYQATTPVPGTYVLNFVRVGQVDSSIVNTVSPTITITQYGSVGQFIVGNFSVQLKKLSDNSLHAVTASFRIRRK